MLRWGNLMVQEAHDPLPRLFIRSRLLHYPPVIKDLSLKSLQLVEPGHVASVEDIIAKLSLQLPLAE
jgi:hypothetical protein